MLDGVECDIAIATRRLVESCENVISSRKHLSEPDFDFAKFLYYLDEIERRVDEHELSASGNGSTGTHSVTGPGLRQRPISSADNVSNSRDDGATGSGLNEWQEFRRKARFWRSLFPFLPASASAVVTSASDPTTVPSANLDSNSNKEFVALSPQERWQQRESALRLARADEEIQRWQLLGSGSTNEPEQLESLEEPEPPAPDLNKTKGPVHRDGENSVTTTPTAQSSSTGVKKKEDLQKSLSLERSKQQRLQEEMAQMARKLKEITTQQNRTIQVDNKTLDDVDSSLSQSLSSAKKENERLKQHRRDKQSSFCMLIFILLFVMLAFIGTYFFIKIMPKA